VNLDYFVRILHPVFRPSILIREIVQILQIIVLCLSSKGGKSLDKEVVRQ